MPDDFYVGYLPIPTRHRRALLAVLPPIVIALVGAMVLMAFSQRDPGDGVWESGLPRTWEGTLVADPFPRLVRDDGSILIVDFGKRGAQHRTEQWTGLKVRVSGWLLERDGRRIVELEPEGGTQAIIDVGPARSPSQPEILGDMTLVGEIMDSKCYLGAMKPGDGKAHKACATLCIIGGIPPALVVHEEDGAVTHYIIVSEDGGRADDLFINLVAEPVRVRGAVERRDGLLFIRATSVDRL